MDIISHGLWGSIALGRKSRRSFWFAFLAGILPDLSAFGPYFLLTWLGVINIPGLPTLPALPQEPPDLSLIPEFVFQTYNVSHSLIVFAVIFCLIWLFRRKPLWELGAWGIHILLDIPTHSSEFFPTPFLWPISDFAISGYSWAEPAIFFPNLAILAVLYIWFFVARQKERASTTG